MFAASPVIVSVTGPEIRVVRGGVVVAAAPPAQYSNQYTHRLAQASSACRVVVGPVGAAGAAACSR